MPYHFSARHRGRLLGACLQRLGAASSQHWEPRDYTEVFRTMEKKMETEWIIGVILGLYGDNGKEPGNYYLGI